MANKKGQMSMGEWPAIVVVMVVAFVTLAIGAQVTNNLNTVNCNTGNFSSLGRCIQTASATPSVASNVTQSGLDTFANTSNLSPMIGLVVIAGIIIGALAFFRRGV